jgi:hypothetical protein
VRIALALGVLLAGCSAGPLPQKKAAAETESAALRRVRQVLARVPEVLAKNHKAFDGPDGAVSGFGAGEAYPQIWLRDSAWIVDAASAYYGPETLTSWLDLHLRNASKDGRLRDWVAKGSAESFLEWAPHAQSEEGLTFDTNTNESDQEPSAALAYCRIERILGAKARTDEAARARRVSRLVGAMDALGRDRTDRKTGLIWSGLTADWGDVSPLYPDQKAIYLDAKTPRTLALYTNVMAFAALDCLASLQGKKPLREKLAARAARLVEAIGSVFWMEDRGFFRIRRNLEATPTGFGDDDERFALGGNALAALFGVATDVQAARVFKTAERLRAVGSFSTISTTLIPPYPAGVFQHPSMREPFRYQNGGQWDWFGAALIEAEFVRGYSQAARLHLDQMASRILRAGPGIHEWYGKDGSPQGSGAYAAAAAAIHNAVIRGLLGVSSSASGYRVVMRTAETTRPFEVPLRAISGKLVVSQTIGDKGIEVEVSGTVPVREVCAVLPPGRTAGVSSGTTNAAPEIRKIGEDTLMCAALSPQAASPMRVSFPLGR